MWMLKMMSVLRRMRAFLKKRSSASPNINSSHELYVRASLPIVMLYLKGKYIFSWC